MRLYVHWRRRGAVVRRLVGSVSEWVGVFGDLWVGLVLGTTAVAFVALGLRSSALALVGVGITAWRWG